MEQNHRKNRTEQNKQNRTEKIYNRFETDYNKLQQIKTDYNRTITYTFLKKDKITKRNSNSYIKKVKFI